MAKKRTSRKSRRFNLRRVRCSPELPLGTLASDTALTVKLAGGTSTTPMVVASVNLTWQISALTADEGPLTVGLAHEDYTVAEIKECLEASAAIDAGDQIAKERANRKIRIVGTIDSEDERLNEGKPLKTKLNWFFPAGLGVEIFVFNEQTGALTTGSSLKVAGDMWVRDT